MLEPLHKVTPLANFVKVYACTILLLELISVSAIIYVLVSIGVRVRYRVGSVVADTGLFCV